MSRRAQCPYCDRYYNAAKSHDACPKCAPELEHVKAALARRELNNCKAILQKAGAYSAAKPSPKAA